MVYALDGLGNLYRWYPATSPAETIAAISSTPLRAVIDADSEALWMSGLNGAVVRCFWEEPVRAEPPKQNAPQCKPLSAEPVHHRVVSAIVRDRNGDVISASADGSIVAWKGEQVNPLISVAQPLPQDTEPLALVSTDPVSILYRSGNAVVHHESGRQAWRAELAHAREYSACVSRDRRLALLLSGTNTLLLIDANTGTERGRWPLSVSVKMAATIDDGFLIVPINGGMVEHISSAGVRSAWLEVPAGSLVSALAGRARDKLVVAGRLDGALQASTRKTWQTMPNAHAGPVFALDIADNGTRLVSGGGAGDPSVNLWSMAPLSLITQLPPEHEHTLASARFHPFETKVAVTADDAGLVVIWDLAANRARGRIRLAKDELINEIEFGGASDVIAFRGISSFGSIAVGPGRVREVMRRMLVDVE